MFKKLLLALLLVATLLQAEKPSRISLTKLYIATFDRAPDAQGLQYWLNSGLDMESIAKSFFDQKETQAQYPQGYSYKRFIYNVYNNLFQREPDAEGLEYWLRSLESNRVSRSLFILSVTNGALGDDADILTNKVLVGLAFVDAQRSDATQAKEIMQNITQDANSIVETLSKYKLKEHTTSTTPTQGETASEQTPSVTPQETTPTETGGATPTETSTATPTATTPSSDIPEVITKVATECTFGPTPTLIEEINKKGVVTWLDEQLNMPSAYASSTDDHLTYLERGIDIAKEIAPSKFPSTRAEYLDPTNDIVFNKIALYCVSEIFDSVWFENAIQAKDQLRQRVAYALSQILVVSDSEATFRERADALLSYYDILAKYAFGNYRDLLIDVSMSPSMGIYLTHQGSKKYDAAKRHQPDENYAREVMQLFTIGLHQLHLNGTPVTGAGGATIPTYTQTDIEELARVFTWWDLAKNSGYGYAAKKQGSYTEPMEFTSSYHDFGEKHVLGKTIAANNSGRDDIIAAVDILMQHPNIAPFVSKKLIQRLVTSNPSPAFVERVAKVFNDNGAGIKGDLKAVIRAIILDKEALAPSEIFTKVKEPVVAYVQFLRAFNVSYLPVAWDGKKMFGDEGAMVKDIYRFSRTYPVSFKYLLGQAPMHAESVFNFYSPDYLPSDIYFQKTKLASPELQIMSEQVMINFSNRVAQDLGTYEKIEAQERGNYNKFDDKYMLSLEPELAVVMSALDNNMSQIEIKEPKQKAIDALVKHLDGKLTGYALSDAQKTTLKSYLNNTAYSADTTGIKSMIIQASTAILTTNTYLMQR